MAEEPSVTVVTAFLSDEWIAALDDAGSRTVVPDDLRLVVQQVVTDGHREVAYVLEIANGRMSVRAGRAAAADVSFTQDRATAAAIARGELSAQVAFMDGRLRLGGDLRSVLARAGDLAVLDDAFAATRAGTEW
jgi:putative sterol carrier protein